VEQDVSDTQFAGGWPIDDENNYALFHYNVCGIFFSKVSVHTNLSIFETARV